jgi:hypothetical protein
LGAESEECCDEAAVLLPIDEVLLDLELGFEVRSVSTCKGGGCGDRDGRELSDICEAEREEGKDESDARGFTAAAWPLGMDGLLCVLAKYGRPP